VPALGGAPGVFSARYAGPGASSEQKIAKLLSEMKGFEGANRNAYFICVIAAVRGGRALAVVSEKVDGEILDAPPRIGRVRLRPCVFLSTPWQNLCGMQAGERASTVIVERRFDGYWKSWSKRKKEFNAEGAENAEFAEKRLRWQRRKK